MMESVSRAARAMISDGPDRRIRRRPLHAEVTDRLRDMIVEGQLPAGGRINEAAVAEALGVSRTPLREALKVLASEGLVELLPSRGARVARITGVEIGQLFEVISGLERHAAELATRRMTKHDLDKLQGLHRRMERHHAARRRHDYFRLNHEIHNLIVALAGNAILESTHAKLMAKARRGRYLAILSEQRWDEAMAEHQELMAAIAAGDAARAGEVMLRHVRRTGEVVSAALDTGRLPRHESAEERRRGEATDRRARRGAYVDADE
jgi:DNA-binding GntR family transcriptional regulator